MEGRTNAHGIVEKSELFVGHLAAVIVGCIFIVVGLGMGVTVVMLPVGLVVGLIGVMTLVWGLFGHLHGPKGAEN